MNPCAILELYRYHSGIAQQSENSHFAQDNSRLVPIPTLRRTYIYIHSNLHSSLINSLPVRLNTFCSIAAESFFQSSHFCIAVPLDVRAKKHLHFKTYTRPDDNADWEIAPSSHDP